MAVPFPEFTQNPDGSVTINTFGYDALYTIDGTTPDKSTSPVTGKPVPNGPISLPASATTTLKARAFSITAPGVGTAPVLTQSSVTSAAFTLGAPVVPTIYSAAFKTSYGTADAGLKNAMKTAINAWATGNSVLSVISAGAFGNVVPSGNNTYTVYAQGNRAILATLTVRERPDGSIEILSVRRH